MDNRFLQQAVALATENARAGQLPFGAVVVLDGKVVATGVNTALSDHDPAAHGEVVAVRNACRALKTLELPGAVVVSSCEPCAICHAVCAAIGISRIVYAAPKEMIPDFRPDPLLDAMQSSLRALAPEQIEYVATEGAEAPFREFQRYQETQR